MSQVVVRNADTGGISVMSQEQLDLLYAGKGWEPIAIDPAFASSVVSAPIVDLAELDVPQLEKVVAAYDAQKPSEKKAAMVAQPAEELREQAKALGLSAGGSKDEIADRIIAAEQETADAAAKATEAS